MEPYWALKARLIPYWMFFNTQNSKNKLQEYVESTKDIKKIYLTLFSNGIKPPGFVSISEWKEIIETKGQGSFLGVNQKRYPADFTSNFTYSYDLQKVITSTNSLPPALTLEKLHTFLKKTKKNQYEVTWDYISP